MNESIQQSNYTYVLMEYKNLVNGLDVLVQSSVPRGLQKKRTINSKLISKKPQATSPLLRAEAIVNHPWIDCHRCLHNPSTTLVAKEN